MAENPNISICDTTVTGRLDGMSACFDESMRKYLPYDVNVYAMLTTYNERYKAMFHVCGASVERRQRGRGGETT